MLIKNSGLAFTMNNQGEKEKQEFDKDCYICIEFIKVCSFTMYLVASDIAVFHLSRSEFPGTVCG